ncbi:MAG: class I SAM-dependent methyltransferase [Actinobacteria bacterium]|nr:class I SAM-dependent methyltransferase [Actinomycetota bacterium]
MAEAGAYNVNGSVREHVEQLGPASYTGVDITPGPGVDQVLDAADLPKLGKFGVVISTEMLEHAEDWQAAVAGLIRALAPGGTLVITTRSVGFPYHGYPADHWRFSTEAMSQIMNAAGLDILDVRADDPGSPGVFCKARKPAGWKWPAAARKAWADIDGVTPMTP